MFQLKENEIIVFKNTEPSLPIAGGKKKIFKITLCLLVFLGFAGWMYYQLFAFSFLKNDFSDFSDGSSSFQPIKSMLEFINMDRAGFFATTLLLLEKTYKFLFFKPAFLAAFSGMIISSWVLFSIIFSKSFFSGGKGRKFLVVLGVFFLGLFLSSVFIEDIFFILGQQNLARADESIRVLGMNLNGEISSGSGRVIGGAQNVVHAIESENAEINGVENNFSNEKIFYAYAREVISGKKTFNQSFIMPLLVERKKDSIIKINTNVVLLPGGYLAVENLSQDEMQSLMPVISERIIRKKFSEYNVSFPGEKPSFSILQEDKYNEHQKKKISEIKEDIKDVIAQISAYIAEANSVIAHNNNAISEASAAENQLSRDKKKYVSELQDMYNKYCKGAYSGASDCKKLKNQIEENKQIIASMQSEVGRIKSQAQSANNQAIANRQEAIVYLGDIKKVGTCLEQT